MRLFRFNCCGVVLMPKQNLKKNTSQIFIHFFMIGGWLRYSRKNGLVRLNFYDQNLKLIHTT